MIGFEPLKVPVTLIVVIKHLLTMTAGLQWDEFSSSSWSDMQRTPDWVEFVMKRPLILKPGSRFAYNSGASHILSVIIKKISGKSAAEFGAQHLFDRMGITDIEWPTDSRGDNFGGWGMSLKPRDMAKIGYLYLKKGMWEGKQLIPKEFVRNSIIRHIGGGIPMFTPYGYQWWVTNETGYNAFFAGGYGGQFIYVIPTLEMIVVITADPNVPSPPSNEQIRSIIRTFIIPSLKDGSH